MSGITLTEVDDATIATPASGKATIFLDDTLGPAYKDDAAAVHSFVGADGELTYQDHGNTGSTETVDADTANVHRLVLNAATVTLTLTTTTASGTPALIRLRCVQDGTGGRLLAFPGSVTWVTGAAPVLRTAAGGVDIIDLETEDGGTTWYGTHGGKMGPAGGAVAIDYTFSTTTTDSDPGAGNLRFDNATTASVTKIRADLLSSDGTTWTTVIDSLDDSTNTVKGHIRLFKTGDPTKWWLGTVSAVDSSSGYRNITVAYVAQSGASPFANGDAITLVFTRAGDVGASGTASVGTDPIFDAKGDLAAGTGADTAAKLTVGSDGQHIVADSSVSTGLKYVSGDQVLISSSVLGSAAANFDLTSIPATYNHLRVVLAGRGTTAANTITVEFQFNGDTAGNYDTVTDYGSNGTTGSGTAYAQTSFQPGSLVAASGTASNPGVIVLDIPIYAQTTFKKILRSTQDIMWATNAGQTNNAVGLWRSTAAINRIKMFPSTGNFDTGTAVYLYGII